MVCFYHRLTHASDYSRQACAEPIKINEDSSICQVEISSSGLEAKPLLASGIYPAVIACNITNGRMPHISNRRYNGNIPKITDCAAKDILRILTAEPLSVTNGLTS